MPSEGPKNFLTEPQLRIASALEDVQLELLAGAGNLDFYAGYNLAASIEERLDQIGLIDAEQVGALQDVEDVEYAYKRVDRYGRATELDRLIQLRNKALAAIEAARNIETLRQEDRAPQEVSETSDSDVLV